MFETSEFCEELFTALSMVQANLENPAYDADAIVPTKKGRPYEISYTTLAGICDHIRSEVGKAGLAIVHSTSIEGDALTVTTVVLHGSGQWLRTGISFTQGYWNCPGVGSALTYARRYALAALFGFAPSEDDGEENIYEEDEKVLPQKPKKASLRKVPSADDIADAREELEDCHDIETLRKVWKLLPPEVQPMVRKDFDSLAKNMEMDHGKSKS